MAERCAVIPANGKTRVLEMWVLSGKNVVRSGRMRERGRFRFGPARISAATNPRIGLGCPVESAGSSISDAIRCGLVPMVR